MRLVVNNNMTAVTLVLAQNIWPAVCPGCCCCQVLAPLGADTSGSQFLEPDGTFPNHIPNPENKEAMAAAVDMVKKSGVCASVLCVLCCGLNSLQPARPRQPASCADARPPHRCA